MKIWLSCEFKQDELLGEKIKEVYKDEESAGAGSK